MSERAVVATASPLTVRLDSGDNTVPALALASYAPTVGDRVAVDRLGSQLVVLGTTGPGGAPASGQRYTAGGSVVGTPSGAGNMTITYGVTFTTALWPVVSSGSGALIVSGFATDGSEGGVTVYDAAGAIVNTGSRRVNWTVTGIIA